MATTNKNFKVKNGLDVNGPIGVGSTPSYGSTGQVLTSQGTGSVPTWTTVSSGGLTATDYVVTGKLSSDQTIASNTNDVLISFVDDFDPQGWWNATSKQFTTNIAGYYNVALHVWWTAAAATTNQYNVQIRKNSNTSAIFQNQTVTGSGSSQGGSRIVYLNGTTDYVDFTAYNGDSSTRSLQWGGAGQGTWFSAALMTAGKGDKGDTGDTGPAGTSPNAFTTVSANGTSVVADSSTDTLTITPGSGMSIVGNATSDTITFSVNGGLVPSGGTAGQILSKSDSTDYNTVWINEAPAASYTSVVKHDVRLGEAITKGQAVYVSSSNGSNMVVSKASNATEGTSSKTLGLLETSGSTNNQRNVVTEGLLGGIDVGSAVAGDPVWLGTSGNLIYGLTNKPIAPAHLVFIGIVTRTGNNGEIFVRPQNGFELNEIHNVLIGTDYSSTPADNDLLAYDSGSSLWKNQTASAAGLQTTISVGNGLSISSSNITVNPGAMLNQIVDGTSGNSYGLVGTSAYLDVKDTNGYNKEIELDIAAVESKLTTDGFVSTSGATFTGNVAGTNISVTGNVNAATVNATTFTGTAAFANTAFSVAITNVSSMGTNVSTFLTTPNSINFLNTITDETGTGNVVFSTSPVLTTPNIGAAIGTSVNVTGQLISTVATGTAPLAVTSTTMVPNLTAQVATKVNTTTLVNLGGDPNTASYLTFVESNGFGSAQDIRTDSGLVYYPLSNTLEASSFSGNASAGTTTTAASGVGYMGMPQNIKSASYTIVAGDAGKHIYVDTTGATITVPTNANVAFPIGTTIVIVTGFASGSTTIKMDTGSDVLRLSSIGSTGNRSLGPYGMATLIKVAATTWFISGNGLT